MRSYLFYIFAIVALGSLSSCESVDDESKQPQESGIKHYFGEVVEIEVEENNATIIATMPRMTVDGHENPKAKIKLGYEAHMGDMVEEEQFQREYGVRDSLVVFKLSKLAPMTEYRARIYIEDERYDYSAVSDDFTFGTARRDPICDFNYDIDIETRGLFATITLDNIEYRADGETHPLRCIELEYRRHGYPHDEMATVEYAAEEIVDGRLVMELPTAGSGYLAYSTMYQYTITIWPEQTIIPEDPVYRSIELHGDFSTTNAEIEVDFSTPLLSCQIEVFDELDGVENVEISHVTAVIDRVDILYDGVPSEDYTPEYHIYDEVIQLCYRPLGIEEWERVQIFKNEAGGAESRFGLYNPEPESIYEVCFAVFAGSDRTEGHYSEIVKINVKP